MKLADKPSRFGEHQNAFGFLRLLFASLVIVSHVPEIVDLNPKRELLYRLVGTMTFGGFAVFGFFVISGYLITGSLLGSGSTRSYLTKRIARIYPGFIAASTVCLLFVVPLSGASFIGGPLHTVAASLFHMAILSRPAAEHPFIGQNFSDSDSGLNGAMWTIQYEFACYLLILLLPALGVLRRRWAVPALAAILLSIATFGADVLPWWLSHAKLFPGAPQQLFFLPGMFLSGSSFYLYRREISFDTGRTVVAALAFVTCLLSGSTMPFGYAVFGSYLIFAAAKAGGGSWVGRINDHTDISYGLYLYAWPVEQLLIRYMGTGSLVLLAALTWVIAAIAGWLSWTLIEKPVLTSVRRRQSSTLLLRAAVE